jgi:hypothetical protein
MGLVAVVRPPIAWVELCITLHCALLRSISTGTFEGIKRVHNGYGARHVCSGSA